MQSLADDSQRSRGISEGQGQSSASALTKEKYQMKLHLYSPAVLGSVFALLAACGGDDVPPGNTSQTVQRQIDTPAESREQSQTDNQQQDDAEALRPEEADLIPEDYTRDGGEIARLAVATLQPTAGNQASGMVVFIQGDPEDEDIRVIGRINDIEPGKHGFHIHEVGNCATPDASSAGEHYNPAGAQHADRISTVRHIGDLGNLEAGEDRTAEFDFYDSQIELQGANSVIEKAFIVHAMEDDLTTQPSGNSGDRITCGVIKRRAALGIPE